MMTKINTKFNVWRQKKRYKKRRKRNNTEVWLLCRLKLCYIPCGTWVNNIWLDTVFEMVEKWRFFDYLVRRWLRRSVLNCDFVQLLFSHQNTRTHVSLNTRWWSQIIYTIFAVIIFVKSKDILENLVYIRFCLLYHSHKAYHVRFLNKQNKK